MFAYHALCCVAMMLLEPKKSAKRTTSTISKTQQTTRMTAKISKRVWIWALAIFGGLLILTAVLAIITNKKKKGPAKQTGSGGSQVIDPSLPSGGSGNTPKQTPPVQPPVPAKPAPGSVPFDVYSIHWEYVQGLCWKMFSTMWNDPFQYSCEITNGVLEMGTDDLKALVDTYKRWYNRSFKDDYCARVKNSGCWDSLWSSKPTQACKRLQNV